MDLSGILIRRARLGDENGLYEVAKEGVKKNWLYTGKNMDSLADSKKYRKIFSEKPPSSYIFIAVEKSSRKILGSVSFGFKRISRIRHVAGFGWGMHPNHQGRGIGTALLKEAIAYAKKKGFRRAEAEVAVENMASLKIAKRCGFKIEGRKKKALLTDDGRYIDTYVMGKVF